MRNAAIVLLALAGCDAGNYSNEDIDFQLAVPERQDIAVRLPAQALETNDSAEHYKSTRATVRSLDGLAEAFLSLIDHVRANPPSERQIGRRVWGPFALEENPLWLARLVIERLDNAQPIHFTYRVEFRARNNESAAWAPLLMGQFTPGPDARHGTGSLKFTSEAARAAGYPLAKPGDQSGGLAVFDTIDIEYKTDAFPLRIKVTLVGFPGKETFVFEHTEEQDGGGSMIFTFPTPGGIVSLLRIHSRWLGSGAGRADVSVLVGIPLVMGMKGTDCWGIDTRPTYVHRDWDLSREFMTEANCVLPAP